jgi:hypothetical protein
MSFFASTTLAEHLVRGVIAFSALAWAFTHQQNMLASSLAFIVALIAFRGCPMCWSIGLVETLMHRLSRVRSEGSTNSDGAR